MKIKKQKKLEWEQEQERLKAEHEKSEKLRAAFLAGEKFFSKN